MPSGQSRGGAEEALRQLVWFREKSGFEALTVCFLEGGDLVGKISESGVEVHQVFAGRLRHVHRYLWTLVRLRSLIRRSGCDLVFSWMTKAHIYGAPVGGMLGLPTVYFQHGVPDRGPVDFLCRLLPASGALACSQYAAGCQQAVTRVPVLAATVGADLDRFQGRPAQRDPGVRQRLGLPEDRTVVGMVGRLQRWKGMHVFAEALAEVRRTRPEVTGVIVGGGHDLEPDYEPFLRRRIGELGLGEDLRLVGKQDNVPEWMEAFDVFVHASEREPFGIVVVEAMAMGKPVIATVPGGPQEILRDGVEGLLVPWSDGEAMSRAILRFLDEPLFALACGAEAQKRAQDFSAQRYAERVGEAVRQLLGSSRDGRNS